MWREGHSFFIFKDLGWEAKGRVEMGLRKVGVLMDCEVEGWEFGLCMRIIS